VLACVKRELIEAPDDRLHHAGAGSAGWWGWLARCVISACDAGSGVAAGSLWGSGLPRWWVSGRNALVAGWATGRLAGCDCGVVGFGWSEPLLVPPMPCPLSVLDCR
jgi:hypothetical protein